MPAHASHRRYTFLVLVVLAVALAQQASAAPPPPSFWNFTISNTTGFEVDDMNVMLYPSVAPAYNTLGTPIAVAMSSLPDGASVVVTLPKSYGISKITATGKCPNQLPAAVEITAPLGDYNGSPGDEYAAFCFEAPPGQTNFTPVLTFRKSAVNPAQREAFLAAKWRWEAHWATQPVKDTKAFP